MIFTLLHDIYGTREVEDKEGNKVEEEYILREGVKTKVWMDEKEIKLILPQYNKKGNLYRKRLLVTTTGESYVFGHTFDELVEVVEKSKKKIGFKTNE